MGAGRVCVCPRLTPVVAAGLPGYIDLYSAREAKDYYNCIEWAAVQPWSNGKIGLNGISYYASEQWQVAAMNPPHLRAICTWEGTSDYYRELGWHGGIMCTFGRNWSDMQVTSVQNGKGTAGVPQRHGGRLGVGSGDADARGTRGEPRRFWRGYLYE